VRIKSATVRSLCKLEWREDKGEGRGFAQWGRRAGDHVPKRRKRREGVWYGDEGEDQERTGGQEKEKHTVHKDGECGTMSRPCEDRVLMGSTPTASAGHAVIATPRA